MIFEDPNGDPDIFDDDEYEAEEEYQPPRPRNNPHPTRNDYPPKNEYSQQEEYREPYPARDFSAPPRQKERKVVSMPEKPNLTAVAGNSGMKMILFQPMSFEDGQTIVDNLRAKKPVIINLVDLDKTVAQRVLDFLSGAMYAIDGSVRRVAYGIYVIVPYGVSIVGNGENEDRDMFD